MELKQLRYFLTVAEQQQISSAAKKLNISQPPLSQYIKTFESQLGVKLFERGTRKTHLTDAGQILARRAAQILELTELTYRELEDYKQGMNGTLTIGTVSSSGYIFAGSGFKNYIAQFPNIKFEIHENNTFGVMDMLRRGVIEMGIVRTPFKPDGLQCEYKPPEPMVAVMTPALYEQFSGSSISLAQLVGKPLIIYRRFEQLLSDTFSKYGVEANIVCKTDDARTALHLSQSAYGIAIVPFSATKLIPNSDTLWFKQLTPKELQTQICAVWIKGRYLSKAAQNFLTVFKEM